MRKTYGYARVSTKGQHLDRQIIALLEYGVNERDIITDKASGVDLDRPGYQTLKYSLLCEGDTLAIPSLDRLSRFKEHISQELRYFAEHHIQVRVLDLPTTMIDLPPGQEWVFEMINNILIEVLSSIAEQERITLRRRQAEGIAAARAKGKSLGRPRMEYPANWDKIYAAWKAGNLTAVAAMKELEVKRTTFYKMVRQYDGSTL